jgi:glucose/arabinose dehydrogenase
MSSKNGFSVCVVVFSIAAMILISSHAGAVIHEIDMVNFEFSPTNTSISHGDTVRWTLVEGNHTSTADTSSPKAWDSGVLTTMGQTFQVQFTEADGFGPFPYHCTLHSATMKDTIRYQIPSVPALTTETVVSGLDRPVYATVAPGDYRRLFVLEAHTGQIEIVDLYTSTVNSTPFLDISGLVSGGPEQGLLGLAFHPDYEQNGYFYINYTDVDDNTQVVRYQVSANPDSADENSAVTILSLAQPEPNHNGGWLGFGPNDGYLYISTGDGGGAGDPNNNGQDVTSLLGKLLRIDVDGGSPYAIPPDNPFAGAGMGEEIWDYGLRNPWRCSFDRSNGDLYIGDVGQNEWEEISFHDAADAGGINFGWRLKEATHCYDPPAACDPAGITTDPIHEISHDPGHCSVIGGYVYRGCAIAGLDGTYFFADWCTGAVWSFRYDGMSKIDFQDRTTELGMGNFGITSFAQDHYGELYIVMQGGEIYKIVPEGGITDCNNNNQHDSCEIAFGVAEDADENWIIDECEADYTCGDADANDVVNVSDVVYLIQFVFGDGDPPIPLAAGDVDCNGSVNVSDIVYLIDFVFADGADPCADCP